LENIWEHPKLLYFINPKNTTYYNAVGTVVINIKSVTKDVSGRYEYQTYQKPIPGSLMIIFPI